MLSHISDQMWVFELSLLRLQINCLLIWATFHFCDDTFEDLLSSHEITVWELVVLNPTLRDVGSTFLEERVEPREDEKHLCLNRGAMLGACGTDLLECSSQIVSNAWGSLVSDLQTCLQQNWREPNMRLRCEPKAELRIGFQHSEFLLENWKPWCD